MRRTFGAEACPMGARFDVTIAVGGGPGCPKQGAS
jgi:hypothetical protein